MDTSGRLRSLAELHASGALSEQEFTQAKAQVLNRPSRRSRSMVILACLLTLGAAGTASATIRHKCILVPLSGGRCVGDISAGFVSRPNQAPADTLDPQEGTDTVDDAPSLAPSHTCSVNNAFTAGQNAGSQAANSVAPSSQWTNTICNGGARRFQADANAYAAFLQGCFQAANGN